MVEGKVTGFGNVQNRTLNQKYPWFGKKKNILLIGYELLGLKKVRNFKDNSTKQNPELKLLQSLEM